jgi:hypothetical protein
MHLLLYRVYDIASYFSNAIFKLDRELTICFIDAGNIEIASVPNFIIELT